MLKIFEISKQNVFNGQTSNPFSFIFGNFKHLQNISAKNTKSIQYAVPESNHNLLIICLPHNHQTTSTAQTQANLIFYLIYKRQLTWWKIKHQFQSNIFLVKNEFPLAEIYKIFEKTVYLYYSFLCFRNMFVFVLPVLLKGFIVKTH